MSNKKELFWCRMRPREGCKVQTYNKHGICSSCMADLQEMATHAYFIKELGIVVNPHYQELEKVHG